ncbi:MAG: FecR domain-containing protein [Acidobacteriota bacterium]|nr:FecR domain-containing protein [Acidobacteriota bacterium]
MKSKVMLFLLLLGIVGAAPIFAGSAAIGTVAGSLNATVSGQALLPNTTVFNGDPLQVKDGGAAIIALMNGSRITLGSQTQARFEKQADGVAVDLATGNASMYHPAKGSSLAVNVENYTVTPGKGYKTVGDVAMVKNGAVVVSTKEGSLHVSGNGRSMDVAQGKTVTLLPKNAAMPQTGTSQKLVSGNTGLEAATLGAAGVGAVLAGVALSRAGDARSSANAATTQAAAATSAATAATSAANAATSAATASNTTANAVGCALNLAQNAAGQPSPYAPPAGMTCVGVK